LKKPNSHIELLDEPKLLFGHQFEGDDVKEAIETFGTYGTSVEGLHTSEVKIGFIGTRDGIAQAAEWIDNLEQPIESLRKKDEIVTFKKSSEVTAPEQPGLNFGEDEQSDVDGEGINVTYSNILNRDFCGFNAEGGFHCRLVHNPRWDATFQKRDIEDVINIINPVERIKKLVELFSGAVKLVSEETPRPDVIIIVLPPSIIEKAASALVSGNYYYNFRRALKVATMEYGIPLQLLQESTITRKKRSSLQDPATVAWNFCTALYYKADGVPWRTLGLDQDTCFIGVSFYVTQDENGKEKNEMRASVAQAFDFHGQGLVVRGKKFEWDTVKRGRTPHLTTENAELLVQETLREYASRRKTPRRVVIHKTSEFWGDAHAEHNEIAGFRQGIDSISRDCDMDLVALRPSRVRLFREGEFPPIRGTYFEFDGLPPHLYTLGFISHLQTYPGSYVPRPWMLSQHVGESSPKEIMREVLALTKMNINNCSYADGTPITLSFAKNVGEILKHADKVEKIQPHYKFYM
jgi:hypothetical protein